MKRLRAAGTIIVRFGVIVGIAVLMGAGVRHAWAECIGEHDAIPSRSPSAGAAKTQGVAGQVTDEQGGAIVGAIVAIKDARGEETSCRSDGQGKFGFRSLEPGSYAIQISADQFRPYENSGINVVPGRVKIVNVTLRIALRKDEITVLSENPLTEGATYSGGSLILHGEDLKLLPQAPGGLEALLRALTLRSAGPFGPQTLVNGFEGNPIPPVDSIREIRVNDNPYSAEYPKPGLGRIEILTKPGTENLHGGAYFDFGDASLNSRNPFAPDRARFQSRVYGGSLSGPITAKRATFFIDFIRQETNSNAVVNATILDSAFNVTPFAQALVTPERRMSFGPRLDIQLNSKNTLVARYSDTRSHLLNSGVGDFSLSSRAQDVTTRAQAIQVTETSTLNGNTINETRFQFVRNRTSQSGNSSIPVISVPGAFTGGGADAGLSYDRENRWELQNFTSWQAGRHVLKGGVQLKLINLRDGSTQNFGGTYTFSGGLAPQLNANNEIVHADSGEPVMVPITTIEAYRRTVLFRSLGYSPAAIRQLGGGASQLSLAAGQIEAAVRQYQIGAFLQDDWRLHPKFSLNFGLRYERQNNISSDLNFAPRLAFAWGLDGGKEPPKTILRAGVGLFYDRVGERLILRARRLNGINQQQFVVSDASVLDLFPVVPSPELLAGFAIPQSIVRTASDLRTPYTVHSSVAIERQLPRGVNVALTYDRVRALHMLRSRDINAPLPGTYDPDLSTSAIRPISNAADIFQYESSGIFDQNQLLANLTYRAGKWMTLWATYTLSDSKSNTDGPDTIPANSYDLRSEYGRSALDARHTFYGGGWIGIKSGIELTPLLLWRSGMPFDITTGRDNNGDSVFTDRPAFATDLSRPSVILTRWGALDLNPAPGQRIIPHNFGFGPGFFTANLKASKRFKLNERVAMILSVQCQNLFNHTNPGLPVGNLGSSLFGFSHNAAGDWGFGSNQAGNRRLDFLLYFSF
jgi:carboxypeptidase family protein/TonB-dependent receptor-like protein